MRLGCLVLVVDVALVSDGLLVAQDGAFVGYLSGSQGVDFLSVLVDSLLS